ncbi:hypothetical protein [Pseudomonas cichorii]|uniref:Uncharacterized protein n=1 Tax=Pseudomonas cichorii TaxID=36746 RepID=A0ABQ1DIG0_PSECI|nr:hypothetical protein [Pseudomonas cichorii]QVE15675.1 hypothetical protein KGD89_17510 [Pseudomonas cichorii]GFM90782.1 hypothetical protein PSCICP_07540 [Pseudomonas cichorii]SDN33653.1 hypothetical protein SAMN05216599_101665 [Pseudomonas cichorii]
MSKIVKHVKVKSKFDCGWQCSLQPDEEQKIEDIGYVLFEDGNGFILAKVDRWCDVREEAEKSLLQEWRLRFSHVREFGSHAKDLLDFCKPSLSSGELETLDRHAKSGTKRPAGDVERTLAVDMDEARVAVARYYHLNPKQIEVILRSSGEIHQ